MSQAESVVLAGDPYERGVAHGESVREGIANNAEFYFDHFAEHGVSERTALEHADEFLELIEEMNPDYVEEMRGVADGSGLSIEKIAIINVRHTILYSAYSPGESADGEAQADSADAVDGCTSFGIQPEFSETGNTLIGQNWDWQRAVESIIMDVRQSDGPNFVALTEAGMVGGKFGLNEHGIGFVVNGLNTPEDGEDLFRKPAHVRGREILDASGLDRAIAPILEGKRPTSRNYLVGHGSGDMLDLETTPADCRHVYPDDGFLTHANHFEHRTDVESTLEKQIPHTLCRGMRIERLLGRRESIAIADLKEILRDHTDHPNGICRHVTSDSESHTNNSVIMDLSERRLFATDGPPCDATYREYEVTPTS